MDKGHRHGKAYRDENTSGWCVENPVLQGYHSSKLQRALLFPVFVIGTPKFQDWVAISIKS